MKDFRTTLTVPCNIALEPSDKQQCHSETQLPCKATQKSQNHPRTTVTTHEQPKYYFINIMLAPAPMNSHRLQGRSRIRRHPAS